MKEMNSLSSNKYDFGWNPALRKVYLIGGLILFLASIVIYVFNPSLILISFFLLLFSINLLVGNFVISTSNIAESTILPFIDIFSSEKDLILDVGCGSGRTTISLGKVMGNRRVIALDRFDAQYIEKGGKALLERNLKLSGISDKVQIVDGDVTKLSFDDKTFDTAVSSYVLDHLGPNKLVALKEINRVLKPNGKFLLIVLVPSTYTYSIASLFSFMLSSRKKWRNMISKSNFICKEEGTINGSAYYLLQKA